MLKRKAILLNDEPSQSKRTTAPAAHDLEEILRKCGYIIGQGSNANEIEVDQAEFVRDLTKYLNAESICSKFLEELEKLMEDEVRFKWSLLPTVTSASCKTARNTCQDSLFHLLLGIEALQVNVSNLLLEKLAVFAFCDSNEIFDRAEGNSLACMILSQFRWLNKLVNGDDLSNKLLELVKGTPTEVQRDIIILLPEVICESDHSKVANSLTEILIQDHELNAAILTTLSNLIIDNEILSDVRKRVLRTLSTANNEDLPGIVRFVLMNFDADGMEETVNELRNNLDFISTFEPLISSTPVNSQNEQVDKNNGFEIMNAVKLSLQFQKQLCDCWIKVLNGVQLPQRFKTFDILVLLVLHSFPTTQKKVEILIKKKIKTGEISEDLLEMTFRGHKQVLKEFIPTLLSLSEVLLKSSDSGTSMYASLVYIKTFLLYNTCIKQEIIGNLVTHITNGTLSEVNAALHTLQVLAKQHALLVVPFALLIKGLLHVFHEMTLVQIRKVYQILSYLCYQGGREGSTLEDDMHIIIRKQLMNKDLRYCKMGIIGALTAAKTSSFKVDIESPELLPAKVSAEHVISWLELVQRSIINSSEAEGLFYDELCRIIYEKELTTTVMNYIDVNILKNFEEYYIIDIPPNATLPVHDATAELKFGIDEAKQPIALNLFSVMKQNIRKNISGKSVGNFSEKGIHKKKSKTVDENSALPLLLKLYNSTLKSGTQSSQPKQASALTLASLFRLLRVRKEHQDHCLDDIDALLGCPIIVPNLEHANFVQLSLHQKDLTLDALFFCINWMREIINAFVSIDDKDTKFLVVLRLQHLVELQELLCKYVQDRDNYAPPLAVFDAEVDDMLGLKFSSKRKITQKKHSKKSKKSKSSDSSQELSGRTANRTCTETIQLESDDDNDNSKSTSENVETLNLVFSILQPYLRELDINVFVLFEIGITFRDPANVLPDEKRDLALHPRELQFLLKDMLCKLRHSLSCSFRARFKSSQKQIGFSNFELKPLDKVILFCIRLLPAFCHLLEECTNYFRSITTESDGIIDSLALISSSSQQILSCMQLIFKIINCFLSWKDFALSKNISLFCEAVRVFASREENLSEDVPLEDLIAQAVEYLAKFDDAVISLGCAAALIEVLETVVGHAKHTEPKKQVSEIAKGFLIKSWLDLEKKSVKVSETNKSIQLILEAYLKNSDNILQALEFLSTEAIPKLMNDQEKESETVFNTLSKSSLPSYYKIMMCNLVDQMKLYYAVKVKSHHEEFAQWSQAIRVFNVLINLIKTFASRSIIGVSLRYGRHFVDLFLKHGMPLLDRHFSANKEEVLSLLKNFQMSTRYMQHVCNHSKVLRDVPLTGKVPFLKKSLECLVYRVKVMLAVNKCEEAFWLGNLKNRDLKGTEILSQTLSDNENSASEKESEDDNESVKTLENLDENLDVEEDAET